MRYPKETNERAECDIEFSFRVSFAGRFMGEISHSPSERMIFDVFFTSSPRQIGRNYASTYYGRGNSRGLSKTKNSPPSFAHSNTHWIKRVFPHENIAPTRVPYEINLFQFKCSLIWATKKEKHVGQNTGFLWLWKLLMTAYRVI